jgi:hypothetical protein
MATKPRVTGRVQQPVTGTGRLNRGPTAAQVFGPWGGARPTAAARPVAPVNYTPPPAPAPVAAPQYSVSNLPPDATYDQLVGAYQKQRDDTLAAVTQQRTSTLGDYGFTEGPGGALAFDPNNPRSKAALLKQTYDTNRRATGQSMGAGGQLYSGAYQNSQDLVNRNQLGSEDSLQKSLINFLAQNTGQAKTARTNYETNAATAYGDRVGRFQSNPLYDPATADSTLTQATPNPTAAANAAAAKPASSAALEVWQKGTYGGRKATYKNGKWYYATASGKLAPIPI